MSPQTNNQPETAPKKPTITESVESFISKKKAEKAAEGAAAVQQSAEGVQSEVAEVIAGAEKPKEKVSEREGESGEKGDIKGGKGAAAAGAAAQGFDLSAVQLPSEEIMVKLVREAIEDQIAMEWAIAKRFRKRLTEGGAQEYASSIARIRSLKEVISSLFFATFDFIKNLYLKYFTPDGKRKPVEEL